MDLILCDTPISVEHGKLIDINQNICLYCQPYLQFKHKYFKMAVDKVAKMFQEMEAEQKHTEIFKSMDFPDTVEMRETREKSIVQCEYQCTEVSCDFSRCLVDIQQNAKLLKFHAREVCEEIVKDIKDHQDDFLPSQVDGYYINRMGHELVHMKRSGCDGKGVTGFIEYNDLRRHSMDFYDAQKIKAINYMVDEASKQAHKEAGCSIM
jgi:hypothetical protein